MQKPKISNKKN